MINLQLVVFQNGTAGDEKVRICTVQEMIRSGDSTDNHQQTRPRSRPAGVPADAMMNALFTHDIFDGDAQ
jgi:hypothetical protein